MLCKVRNSISVWVKGELAKAWAKRASRTSRIGEILLCFETKTRPSCFTDHEDTELAFPNLGGGVPFSTALTPKREPPARKKRGLFEALLGGI